MVETGVGPAQVGMPSWILSDEERVRRFVMNYEPFTFVLLRSYSSESVDDQDARYFLNYISTDI